VHSTTQALAADLTDRTCMHAYGNVVHGATLWAYGLQYVAWPIIIDMVGP